MVKKLAAAFGVMILITSSLIASSPRSNTPQQIGKPTSSDDRPSGGSWHVADPITFKNLAIYPVTSTKADSPKRYITLDEGLRKGTVLVSEIGTNGRAHRLRRGEDASDDAEVNRLLVTNRSGKTLLLIAGEMVVGGKQDRIIGHDCLVASGRRRVPIDVFCVEHGRWTENPAFGQTREDAIADNARPSVHRRVGRGTSSGVGAGATAITISGRSSYFGIANGVMAAPKVREKAQLDKSQTDVWAGVAELESQHSSVSSTGTLNGVFEDQKVRTKLDEYENTLNRRLPSNCVGVVAAINGEIVSGDVFANTGLFRAYWPKLLRSLALQAGGTTESKTDVPEVTQARTFLASNSGSRSTQARTHLYQLVEQNSERDASFELKAPSSAVSEVIHLNKVTKH